MTNVTGLITAYNEEIRIAQAVRSLLRQSLLDIEVLVIDDGSTDGTAAVLAAIEDPRLRVINAGRLGRAGALRLGCESARGRYIAILDADDEAFPERLERQAALLDARPEIAWIGGGEERLDSQRDEHADRLYPETDRDIRRMAARCIPYCHSAVMFRRSLIEQGLAYDPDRPFLIDFEFFLRVAEAHQVANLPEIVVKRRLRDDSYFQSAFSRSRQNRALAGLCLSAVWRFHLPIYYAAFPAARFGYLWLPNPLKRAIRRIVGLREEHRPRQGAGAR